MRQLRIDVEVGGHDAAIRDLGRVDKAVDGVTASAKRSDAAFADFKKRVADQAASSRAAADASAHAAQAADQHAAATTRGSGALKAFNTAMGVVAAYNVAGMLKDMAIGAVNLAGEITDMSKQSGVMTSTLLQMVNAADLSGVSAESLARQITKLTESLVNGDKSAVAGVKALGLNLGDLLKMSADDRYNTIIGKLAEMGEGATQTGIAYDIFKRQAVDALKLANDGFLENTRNATTWSENQIRILENLGDQWTKFKQGATDAIGTVMAWMGKLDEVANTALWWSPANMMADMPNAPGKPNALPSFRTSPIPMANFGSNVTNEFMTRDLDVAEMLQKQYDDTAKSAAKTRGEVAKLNETLLDQRGWDAHVRGLQQEARALADVAQLATIGASAITSLNQARYGVGRLEFEGLLPGVVNGIPSSINNYANWVSTPGIFGAATPLPPSAYGGPKVAGFSEKYGWNAMKGFLPNQIMGAFSGGNVGGGLGAIAGGMGGTALGGMFSGLAGSGFLSGGMATTFAALGSFAPVIGTIAGGVLGKVIGGLFGPSKNAIADREATGRIGTTQGQLLQQYGSVENIAGMNVAGQELAAGWGHQGRAGEADFNALLAEFNRMTAEQNALLDEQATKQATLLDLEQQRAALAESLVPTWDAVSAAMERYGISVDGAGKIVQQMAATDTWTSMLNDIQLLERAGIDVGGMLVGMQDEINTLVEESQRLGLEIPANMRPYIEELARAGLLTTDLKDIKWGDPVKTQADIVAEAMTKLDEAIALLNTRLEEIANLLREMLPAAAAEGARGVQDEFDRNRPTLGVDVEYNDPGYNPDGRVESFDGGTHGLRDFGRGTLAVLHDREAVVTEPEWRRMSSDRVSAPVVLNVTVDASGAFFDTESSRQALADKVAGAIMLRTGANVAFAGAA